MAESTPAATDMTTQAVSSRAPAIRFNERHARERPPVFRAAPRQQAPHKYNTDVRARPQAGSVAA
jgi:hypothetical protein